MDKKDFSVSGMDYVLYEDGSLYVDRKSWQGLVPVPVSYSIMRDKKYPRYAFYERWVMIDDDYEERLALYEIALENYNDKKNWFKEDGELLSRSLSDVLPPVKPVRRKRMTTRRSFIGHASLVMKYWWNVAGLALPYFKDWDTSNLSVHNISSEAGRSGVSLGTGRPGLSENTINLVLANCAKYTSSVLSQCLGITDVSIRNIIGGQWRFKDLWNRELYAMNIRSVRGIFWEDICYEWELDVDYVNRFLVKHSNEYSYYAYCARNQWSWKRRIKKWRMGYKEWHEKYAIANESIAWVMIKRWVTLNAEYIEDMYSLLEYIDKWTLDGYSKWGTGWGFDRYLSYIENNRYRMPKRVSMRARVFDRSFVLSEVGVAKTSKTLFDVTDFQLVNVYDMCMWDLESLNREDIVRFLEELETEPNWDSFLANGYGSREEFWQEYESLLGGGTIWEFRISFREVLKNVEL